MLQITFVIPGSGLMWHIVSELIKTQQRSLRDLRGVRQTSCESRCKLWARGRAKSEEEGLCRSLLL